MWKLDEIKGNANTQDLWTWFNEQLMKEGLKEWERNNKKWNYVQWKLEIPKGNKKIWTMSQRTA